jgi:NAD(P)-dependent dehydrogenase (short-subunit alcohol dehydrogenase family)
MPTTLITGANRGIGLEFARQYAGDGWRVFAACREPAKATALKRLGEGVSVHPMDVADHASVEALAKELRREPIDLLINNAGIYGKSGQRFGRIDYDDWARVLRVNTMGPLKVAECFADNVAKSDRKLIVAITSYMGSIADAGGGAYHYGSSKAALNYVCHALADDLGSRGIVVAAISPGWVQTDMGGRNAPLTVEQSITAMRRTIARLKPSDSGRSLDENGRALAW